MFLCQSCFLWAVPLFIQTYVGHIAGRGRESPRKGTGGSSLLLPGPHKLMSHPVFQICWVGGSSQAWRESCWSAKLIHDPHTHSLVCCPEPAVRQQRAFTSPAADRDPPLPPSIPVSPLLSAPGCYTNLAPRVNCTPHCH